VAGSCEHRNETLGTLKDEEFLDQVSVLSASQEILCSVKLAS
jgi:hypothetical protein